MRCCIPAGQDLVGTGKGRNPGCKVNSLAAVTLTAVYRYCRVKSDSHPGGKPVLTPVLGQRPQDSYGASGRREGVGKDHEESVASAVDFLASMRQESLAKSPIVPVD